MPKNGFDQIMRGLEEARAHASGEADAAEYRVHVPQEIDVRDLRTRMGLSQTAFAARFGFSPAAVRDWEQKRRRPEAAARAFLTVIQKEPEAVDRALAS